METPSLAQGSLERLVRPHAYARRKAIVSMAVGEPALRISIAVGELIANPRRARPAPGRDPRLHPHRSLERAVFAPSRLSVATCSGPLSTLNWPTSVRTAADAERSIEREADDRGSDKVEQFEAAHKSGAGFYSYD